MALAAVAMLADPAAAGGSWLRPVRDRYEPGEIVALVGYAGPSGSQGSIEDGPFFAYLRRLDAAVGAPTDLPLAPFSPQPTDLRLGQLAVEPTGRTDYAAYRVSIQFRFPTDLPVGRYAVSYCNATCTKGLTDLIGGVIFVGVDPDLDIGPTPRPAPNPVAPLTRPHPADDVRTVARASERSAEHGPWTWAFTGMMATALIAMTWLATRNRTRFRSK